MGQLHLVYVIFHDPNYLWVKDTGGLIYTKGICIGWRDSIWSNVFDKETLDLFTEICAVYNALVYSQLIQMIFESA